MPDIDCRPSWCPLPTSVALMSYAGVFCIGRLKVPVQHDDLWDTHCFCECQQDEGVKQEQSADDVGYNNLADLIYIGRCMRAGIEDILGNKLYRPPGFGTDYGFEEARKQKGEMT